MPFASSSVTRHVLRGLLGLVAVVGGLAATSWLGPLALLLLPVALLAWRGCPTCWLLGLLQTVEQRRECRDGACAGGGRAQPRST